MKTLFKYPNKLGARIYLSMLALLGGSFFFIGIFTFYNFKNQNKEYHNNRLLRKESATLASIEYFLESEKSHGHTASGIYELFQHKIYELADIHNLDIIIYNLKGTLLLCSNAKLLDKEVIPQNIDKSVLERLLNKKERVKESADFEGREYLNSYQYIFDLNGAPLAIVSIPYFQLDETYKRDLRTYLVALSPIYIILFLGASIMAFLLSRQITEPIRRLSQTMRKAAVMKRYMPLRWNSSDEIGQLVHQYNFMVKELEKSAEILAKTQKESAWKEMAKQVAHEIKNPLTPMKLNVQMFERRMRQDDPEFNQKVKRFCDSMIEQVDTLAHIASAFSDFARMPVVEKKKIDLSKIVENAASFFDPSYIKIDKLDENCFVLADQDQLIRVLNNLLNNALEAIPNDRETQILVSLEKKHTHILLTIKDNGVGIPKHLWGRIFEPNFTTKNSGMGLGLAMVKRIIDDLNGTIHFDSEHNIGTTFYISLALLNQKD